jgi:hypothetical protein
LRWDECQPYRWRMDAYIQAVSDHSRRGVWVAGWG